MARLDGSFKNAVIQGLDKPHCLVVHPLHGYVPPPPPPTWALGASLCRGGRTWERGWHSTRVWCREQVVHCVCQSVWEV